MSSRAVLVIGDDPELAVGLRDRLDRAYVTVREVRPAEALDAIRDCVPWPWMVVGSGVLDDAVVERLARRPVLVLWRDLPPEGLPSHAIRAERFSELAGIVETALGAHVAGMGLAIDGGVTLPDGGYAGDAALEALVAAHPRPLDAPISLFQRAGTTLAAHGVPLRPAQLPDGGVGLVDAEDG